MGSKSKFALLRYLDNGRIDGTFARFRPRWALRGGLADLAFTQDGKIVALGGSPSGDFLVARYTSRGRLDPSFGGRGFAKTDFGHTEVPSALATQPDGRIVVAGFSADMIPGDSGSISSIAIARYSPDGSLDSSFGVGGRTTTTFHGFTEARAIQIENDGSIIVAGTHDANPIYGRNDLLIAKYSSGGSLDSNFGQGGVITVPFPPSGSTQNAISGIDFLPDGRLAAVGDALIGGGHMGRDRVVIMRRLPDGGPDPTLGSDGASVFGSLGLLFATAAEPDGSELAGSAWFFRRNEDMGLAVSRFSPSGGFDRRFGRRGTSLVHFRGARVAAGAIAPDSGGRVLIAGSYRVRGDGGRRLLLVRLKSNGKLDRSFEGHPRGKRERPLAHNDPFSVPSDDLPAPPRRLDSLIP